MPKARALRSRLARLGQVSAAERRAAVSAALVLPPVVLALNALGMHGATRLASALSRTLPAIDRALPALRVAVLLESVANGLAEQGVPRITCLARSLALRALLARRGEAPALRLGVRKHDDAGKLDAHAWVELDGAVLNDSADVAQRYAVLDGAG